MINKQIDSVGDSGGLLFGYSQGNYGTMVDTTYRDHNVFSIVDIPVSSAVAVVIDQQGLPLDYLGPYVIINGVQFNLADAAFDDANPNGTQWSWEAGNYQDTGMNTEVGNTVAIVFGFEESSVVNPITPNLVEAPLFTYTSVK